jgi:hypothetical protein
VDLTLVVAVGAAVEGACVGVALWRACVGVG